MKTLIKMTGVLAVMLAFPVFSSCSSDDDDKSPGNGGTSDIVGNWFMYNEYEPEFYSFKKNGNFTLEICAISNDKIIEWDDEDGKYKTEDGVLVLKYSDKDIETEYYEYKVKKDFLILTDEYGNSFRYERTDCRSLDECLDEMDY